MEKKTTSYIYFISGEAFTERGDRAMFNRHAVIPHKVTVDWLRGMQSEIGRCNGYVKSLLS